VAISFPEVLSHEHDVSEFDCGKPALNNWLKMRALSNQARGFTVVMVVHEDGHVVGFYGLAPTAVSPAQMPRAIKTGQPPNPIPCILLGQLATDLRYAGRGIASSLLRHALDRSVQAAELIGGRALLVHAIDDEAAAFWRSRGFIPKLNDPLMLFRGMKEIEATVQAGQNLLA
jgi:GNAT superfamily N-acetyltransferase